MGRGDVCFRGFDGVGLSVAPASGRVEGVWATTASAAEELDFATPAELCRCCARRLVVSGSRWSVWFCDQCVALVKNLNQQAGHCVVPVGRDSVMNGVALAGGCLDDDGAIDDFVARTRELANQTERLEAWTREIVRRNCVAAGFGDRAKVPIVEYLDAIHESTGTCAEAFDQMMEWWTTHPTVE